MLVCVGQKPIPPSLSLLESAGAQTPSAATSTLLPTPTPEACGICRCESFPCRSCKSDLGTGKPLGSARPPQFPVCQSSWERMEDRRLF